MTLSYICKDEQSALLSFFAAAAAAAGLRAGACVSSRRLLLTDTGAVGHGAHAAARPASECMAVYKFSASVAGAAMSSCGQRGVAAGPSRFTEATRWGIDATMSCMSARASDDGDGWWIRRRRAALAASARQRCL